MGGRMDGWMDGVFSCIFKYGNLMWDFSFRLGGL